MSSTGIQKADQPPRTSATVMCASSHTEIDVREDLQRQILQHISLLCVEVDAYVSEEEVFQFFQRQASLQQISDSIATLERKGEITRFKNWITEKSFLTSTEQLKKQGEICPDCGSAQFTMDRERGETICERCGTVISQRHVLASFLRANPPRDRITDDRMFLITSLPRKFGRRPNDSKVFLPGSGGLKTFLLSRDHGMREHANFVELDRICQKVKASRPIRNEAARLFIRLVETGERIHDRTSLMMAIVLGAYRMHGYAMEAERICSPDQKKLVLRAYRKLKQLGVFWSETLKPPICLDRILSRLKIELTRKGVSQCEPNQINALRFQMFETIEHWELLRATVGRSPYVVAALAIYETSLRNRMDLTAQVIGKAASVRPESISRFRRSLQSLRLAYAKSLAQRLDSTSGQRHTLQLVLLWLIDVLNGKNRKRTTGSVLTKCIVFLNEHASSDNTLLLQQSPRSKYVQLSPAESQVREALDALDEQHLVDHDLTTYWVTARGSLYLRDVALEALIASTRYRWVVGKIGQMQSELPRMPD